MSEIFISYSRPDRDKAEQLARMFERQGWAVWWDRELAAGSRFAEVIATELSGAKAVVTLWSQSSVASNWVKDEAQEGATRNALVPVLIDKTNLPLGFRQFQAADLSGWDGSDSHPEIPGLLRAVAELIKRPYTPPAPVPPRPRPTWLYAAVGVALVCVLGFAAYRWIRRDGGPGPNVNNSNVAVGNNNNSGTQGATVCDSKASRDAADLTGKGLTYIDKDGNHAAAILQFNEAIRVCADYADAYFYRGQSYAVLGKKERAVSDFNKVVQLSADPATDEDARALIASLSGPPPTPTPKPTPNTTPPDKNTTNNAPTPTPPPPPPGPQNANGTTTTGLKAIPVRDIFASDRATRINATTRLIVEKKRDAGAVKEAVVSALADPDNKSGVINTLVYLENVDPSILRQYKPEIEKLLAVAEKNGSQTQEHIKKVRERMGG
ncbi:MAG TPA: TIR domain-containing protein [Pyrinomonadaceae bacterium]|nr:TIR domain-containing protein [Pyrinomonadaceae bacterium]